MQQSLGLCLGAIDYDPHPNSLQEAIQCLLECVDRSSSTMKSNIEGRRNCYLAMPQILATIASRLSYHMSPEVVNNLFDALCDGLEDYTIDERGDVGSWIRAGCIRGLTSFSEILISSASTIPNFEEYFPPTKYHSAIGGILRQGVERLDNVRQEAGECFLRLLLLSPPTTISGDRWLIEDNSNIKQLFLSGNETLSWSDGSWLFPKAVRLLEIERYRKSILTGLVLSLGSKTDSTQRPVALSLVSYARTLPMNAPEHIGYDLLGLVKDLLDYARSHITSNAIVVPVLQTFNVLLEGDALERLKVDTEGLKILQVLLSIISKNTTRLKSIQRIHESMKVVVNLLTFDALSGSCVSGLDGFLTHQFPRIRVDTAEYLYIVLQSKDVGRETDEVEDILLETEWSSDDISVAREASTRLIGLFSGKE